MLYGRTAERTAIRALLAGAQHGAGGAVVLRGEPGIGKTALLAEAEQRAVGMRVLRTAGVEPESELGHAAMHRLLLPLLDAVPKLPPAQADALDAVFGRSRARPPDRFLVALATLTLLADAAQQQPLLCLVDDAHWADRPSLDALAFAARRVTAEPIALLVAARSDAGRTDPLAGLPELPLAGLDRESSRRLLRERGGAPADEDLLLRTAAGNPLALRELPAAIPPGGAARFLVASEPLPLVDRLQEAFLDRVYHHSAAARQLLLLAAADGTGRLAVLRRGAAAASTVDTTAGIELDVDDALGELGDVLAVNGPTVEFRHPLIRSAIYHDANPTERRTVHRALAAALEGTLDRDPDGDPGERDRRAWHLAQAIDGPDETVAAELERAAERAIRRAGPAAAASAFARAAELTREVATELAAWSPPRPRRGTAATPHGPPRVWPWPRASTARAPTASCCARWSSSAQATRPTRCDCCCRSPPMRSTPARRRRSSC